MHTPQRTSSPYSRILGVGAYRPARVVSNAEVCESMNSSDEWIRSRSGIHTRRFAGADETVAAMSVAAAGKALAQAGIGAESVGLVLVATMSNLRQTPPVSAEVADRLTAHHAGAVDIAVACAGFCYGLSMAADAVRGGSCEYVLVIGCERMSDLLDPTDRSTAFLFGDGAGAVLVGPSDTPGIGPVVWGADGSRSGAIAQSEPWSALRDDPAAEWPTLRMAGPEVYRWAVTEMAPVAQRTLQAAGLDAADLGTFIPHQANLRIVDALAKALRLPEHVVVARDVIDTGNTSGASVPLAMERLLSAGEVHSGDLALLMGFGAGLSYAGQVVTLP